MVGLQYLERGPSWGRWGLAVADKHINSNGVVHGGAIYTLADTCMGATLHADLAADEVCTTVEIKISYFKPVRAGMLICEAKIINRGRRVVTLEAAVNHEEQLIAKASGTFYVLKKQVFSA
jgi:acyl-CoA thioesterase